MHPAFSSPKQAVAFALLYLFGVPWLAGKSSATVEKNLCLVGLGRWALSVDIKADIAESNDIDIIFIGSARMNRAINAPYLQEKLDERLGQKTSGRSIC